MQYTVTMYKNSQAYVYGTYSTREEAQAIVEISEGLGYWDSVEITVQAAG